MSKNEWCKPSEFTQRYYEKQAEHLLDYGYVGGSSTKEVVNRIARRIYEI